MRAVAEFTRKVHLEIIVSNTLLIEFGGGPLGASRRELLS
jgi:hypothetical protein